MQAWHFTEMPYPHASTAGSLESMRVTIPSKLYDPKIGSDLYNRYLDEHVIADELGLNIMLNEHHQTATCLDAAAPLIAAILARQTKKARICILGNPIANRGDPIRIAEEMAMIDNISRGRLDVGIVRGVPYEIFAANTNPTQTLERLWEGVDLIVKAWTSHDGPFNFEGRFTHRRVVNVWPRPYQQPHPMIWITGSSDYDNIKKVASRGYVFATFLQPHDKVKLMFDAYRSTMADHGLPGGGGDGFHAARLYRRLRGGGGKGRQRTHLVYADKNAPAVPQSARLRRRRNQREGAARRLYRPHRCGACQRHGLSAGAGRADVRNAGFRRKAGEALLRPGRRLRSSIDDAAGRLPRSQAHGPFSMTLFAKEVYPQIKDLPRTVMQKAKAMA